MKTKMKNQLTAAVLVAILSMQTMGNLAHASDGAGTRGGGLTVEALGGGRELYDLHTRRVNAWLTSEDILAAAPEFKTILAEIEKLDWYFAFELERELEQVTFNMTGPLFTDPKEDPYTFVLPDLSPRKQLAYRFGLEVYVDEEEFNKLKPLSKGYLVLHELMHSYIPMKTFDRYTKLVSMVKTFSKVVKQQIITTKALHLQMQRNGVDFPTTATELAQYKKQVKFYFAKPKEQKEMLMAATNPDTLILSGKKLDHMKSLLANWDRIALEAISPEGRLMHVIANIFQTGTNEEVAALLAKPFKCLNPALIALYIHENLDPERVNLILNSAYGQAAYQGIFNLIEGDVAEITIKDSRISSSQGAKITAAINTDPYLTQYLMNLKPVNSEDDLNFNIKGWAQLIVIAIQNNQQELLKRTIGQNLNFYSSFTHSAAKSRVRSLVAPVAREQGYALQQLETLSTYLTRQVLTYIKKRVTTEQYLEFKNLIDFTKLNPGSEE